MKKYALILACVAAFSAGCSDSEDSDKYLDKICGYGYFDGTTCVCDSDYYKTTEDGSCINKKDTPKKPDEPAAKCYATIYYTNAGTSASSGGTQDWNVYLIGDFNEWKTADSRFKMTPIGDGTHAIKLEISENQKIEYKFYVDGWAEASYQTTEADGKSNIVTTFSSCDMSVGDSNGKTYTGEASAVIGSSNGGNNNNQPAKDCSTTFKYSNEWLDKNGDGSAVTWPVYLVGSFNTEADGSWKKTDPAYLMTGDGNGNRTITVNRPEGSCYEYKYYIDGWGDDSWKTDGANNDNGIAVISSCGRTFGNGVTDSGTCNNNTNPGNNGGTSVVSAGNCWVKSVPTVQNKNISFEIECKDGTTAVSSITGGVSASSDGLKVTDTVSENGKYSYVVKAGNNEVYVPVWVEDKPFDWHDAVLYFAFTDRFKDGDSGNNNPATDASQEGTSSARWLGGDFKGLKEKVEEGYFTNLGVNTLWISSVSMNAQGISWGSNGDTHSYSAYHSYWPVSSFMTDANMGEFTSQSSEGVAIKAIEPHFGSMDDLKNLVDACHKRGIRVLIDFAANQVHKDSPVFKNHRDWFNDVDNPKLCDTNDCNGSCWDNYPEKCWFSADLPDIDYGNGNARKAMIDHIEWLVKTTNVDGFRVDAVKHMNVQFIKDMRARTDQLYNNSGSMFYMVGETFDGSIDKLNGFIGNDMLHAQFDFNLYFAIRDNILKGFNLGNVKNAFDAAKGYKSDLMGTFIGNHDVARALSIAAAQNENKWGQNEELSDWVPYFRVKMAWTILMTNPGVPLIYYGDEYGQEGANDPDNRRMMKFDNLNDQQKMQLGFVQQLGQIRAAHSALRRGGREDLTVSDKAWCYKISDGSETILVALGSENGAGCDLKGTYTLQNLLNPAASDLTGVSNFTFDDNNKLSVFLVK